MRLRVSIALAGLLAMLGVGAPVGTAAAAPVAYPPTICATLSVSTTTPLTGSTITVSGTNFAPRASVKLELQQATVYPLGTVRTNAQGDFSTAVRLPSGVKGKALIWAVGGATAGCRVRPVLITIQARAGAGGGGAGGNGGGTAFTGVDVLLLVLLAALLVSAGVAINRAGKRRKQAEWYAS